MLITLLHGLAGGLLSVWVAQHAELSAWQMPAMAGVLAAAAAMAALGHWLARRALPPVPGRLRWDGQVWSLRADPRGQTLHRLVVALDLGLWALLQLHPVDGRPVWRVAGARSAQGQWHGLRVALATHAGTPGSSGVTP